MKHTFAANSEHSSQASPWTERVLMAAVIATMLLSLVGYMRG